MTQRLFSTAFGAGPDLLLVHGWGMHSGIWGEFAQVLARNFRITVVDLPGHGQSPMLDEQGLASWTEAVLDVAPSRAHWLGWSLGGQIALYAAVTQPARVQELVMLCSNPCFVTRPDWPTAMPSAQFEDFYRLVRSDGADALTRFSALQIQGLDNPRSLLKQTQALLGQCPAATPQALLAGLDILRTTDLRDALAELTCPALALFGGNDALVPATVAGALRANTIESSGTKPSPAGEGWGEENKNTAYSPHPSPNAVDLSDAEPSPSGRGQGEGCLKSPHPNLLPEGEGTQRLNSALPLQVKILPNAAHQPFLSHPADCTRMVTEFLLAHHRS